MRVIFLYVGGSTPIGLLLYNWDKNISDSDSKSLEIGFTYVITVSSIMHSQKASRDCFVETRFFGPIYCSGSCSAS